MNYPTLNGDQVRNDGCGRTAMQTRMRTLWQSLLTTTGNRADPPDLVDLQQLALDVRRTWPTGGA